MPVTADTDTTTAPSLASPPAGAHAITLPCSTALWLLPQRAVWWPAARMAFVADVHFGKAATFRRAGQPVPHGTTADNLARLDTVLAVTGAEHLVFLGDFLHARSGADERLWQQLQPWRQHHAHIAMTLVRGNHDLHAGDPPRALGIDLADEPWQPLPGAPVAACHHPQTAEGATVLAGHLHPTTTLYGPARDAMRLPCYALTPGLLVLPAFGAFTGTSSQSVPPMARRFAVVGDRVMAITLPAAAR
ncbi:ligase-associated DNA damage response endonuclease PdeM [Acidovorax sp. LjRoot117]